MASLESTLLANVRANLQDTTNWADLSAFGGSVRCAPVLVGLPVSPPYCVVTPGGLVSQVHENGEVLAYDVIVWVVTSLWDDDLNESVVVGSANGTDAGTLAKLVRDVLVRGEPYRRAPYTTSPYTDVPAVVDAVHVETGAYQPLFVEAGEVVPSFVARPVRLRYTVVET